MPPFSVVQPTVPALICAITVCSAVNDGFRVQSAQSTPDCQPPRLGLVGEHEVEERADARLAVREAEGVGQLRRLVGRRRAVGRVRPGPAPVRDRAGSDVGAFSLPR